ncbi:MAG: pyridoxal-phosphate dependent enzyme [Mogibacterium sp.]|nr:pyridoxal-phosphate dependent enzyme [Mogibacterium sp.]
MLYGHGKIEILHLPTPLEHLKNVSEDLGVNVYCKRDDLTGLATGGNKLRKLEYFLKDAIDKGATVLITEGGAQTNHGRLTAAVAAKYGLKCAIITADQYPGEISANLLLDGMLGCDVYFVSDMEIGRQAVIDKYTSEGETVYYVPMGGSNEIGMLGYMECAAELDRQAREMGIPDAAVYVTVGSMGTYLGMLLGLIDCGSGLKLKGINVLPYAENTADDEANETELRNALWDYYCRVRDSLAGGKDVWGLKPEDFDFETTHIHGAYNNAVSEVRDTMYYLARKEAIIIDPCYTGKTFEAVVDDAKSGKLPQGSDVIFMHTGGLPGIYTKHHRIELEKELMPYMHIGEF